MSLRYLAAIVFPLGIGLAVLAHPLVLSLFGPHWYRSIVLTQVLAVYAVFSTLNIPAGTTYKVSGRAHILLAVIVPYLIVLCIALLLFAHRGTLAVAICMTACQATGAIVSITIAGKILAVQYRRIVGAMAAPFGAALSMGVLVFPIAHFVKLPWPALIAGGIVGVVSYTGLLWLFARDIPDRMRAMIASRLSGRADVVADRQ